MSDIIEVDDVELASAVPIFPPRPDAIATLVTTDDFLPGAQTLLYSVQVRVNGSVTILCTSMLRYLTLIISFGDRRNHFLPKQSIHPNWWFL